MSHRPQLDGLRAVAFLGVFVHHGLAETTGAGDLGVSLFFVLSGFLITRILLADTQPHLGGKLVRFYWRRTLRIFPLYYFTLLMVFLLGTLPLPWWNVTYLLNIKIYLDRFWPVPINHFWSLAVEEQFYLVWPVLFWLTPARFRPGLYLVLWLLSKLCRGWFMVSDDYPWHRLLTPVCGEFLLWGALAGWWEYKGRPLRYSAEVLIALGLFLVAGWHAVGITSPLLRMVDGTPDGIGFALIVLGLWRCEGSIARWMSHPVLVYFGKISYGLYVYHNLIILLRQHPTWFGYSLQIQCSPWLFDLPVTIVVASVSYYVLEKPFLRLKDAINSLESREC